MQKSNNNISLNIPKHSQWLSGQGCGVWFCIDSDTRENFYKIRRYSEHGSLDCERIFYISNNLKGFDLKKPYQFKHISHCAKCEIEQDGKIYIFKCLTT